MARTKKTQVASEAVSPTAPIAPSVPSYEVPKIETKGVEPLESQYVRVGAGYPIYSHPVSPGSEAMRMYEHFAAQPRIPFYCPLGLGEKPGAWQWYQCNTLAIEIKKGEMVMLPKQVCEELMESLKMTSEAINPLVVAEGRVVPANLAFKPSTKEFEK